MTEINNGSASLLPAYNQIERTFMVANYGANGGCERQLIGHQRLY